MLKGLVQLLLAMHHTQREVRLKLLELVHMPKEIVQLLHVNHSMFLVNITLPIQLEKQIMIEDSILKLSEMEKQVVLVQ